MRKAYPIVLIPEETGYSVFIPDFNTGTQGDSLADAVYMAEDAIGLLGIDLEDDGKPIPEPSMMKDIDPEGNEVALAVVDFAEYRRKHDAKVVKKNCTVPGWLCYEAEEAGINFSRVLQEALKRELNLVDA